MNGFIILDKDSGTFSRNADWRVAKLFGEKKFGHIGTLDPMATGVLPIAIGNATKMIPFIEDLCGQDKEYMFGLRFGFETDTLDITGTKINESNVIPNDADISRAIAQLTGEIDQVPPKYSAVHVNGKRAYILARKGKDIEMPSRRVTIKKLEYTGIGGENEYNFVVQCSHGTYVRSIVRDIAKLCGALATTTYIRRTRTNGFDIKNAVKLDFLENMVNNGDVNKYLLAPDWALGGIPVINLDDTEAAFYKHGGFIKRDERDGFVRVYCGENFVGIGRAENGIIHPKRTI